MRNTGAFPTKLKSVAYSGEGNAFSKEEYVVSGEGNATFYPGSPTSLLLGCPAVRSDRDYLPARELIPPGGNIENRSSRK